MATKVDKQITLNKFEIIKYQLMHHCFVNRIRLSDTELNCLSLLGELGQVRLSEFSKIASAKNILGSPIAVASCLSKIERSGLFMKKNNGKKIIFLNPELKIQSEGTIVINLKLIKLETNSTGASVQKDSKSTELI